MAGGFLGIRFRLCAGVGSVCSCLLSVRFSGFTLLFFMLFSAFFIWQLVSYALSMMRLVDMYRFYTYLLHIPDVSFALCAKDSTHQWVSARYSDNIVARGCAPYRSYPRRQPTHRHLVKFSRTSVRHGEARCTRHRQQDHAPGELPNRVVQQGAA